jgi:hypothetical protein
MEETFGIVLVLGLAIFGSIFVVQSADGGFLSGDEEVDTVFVDKSYGTLGESNPDDRVIDFGDFTVGEARGEVRAYRNEKATISDSLLGGENIVFRYNATQPRQGDLAFEVLGRDGRGEVYVKANGEEIYSEALIATGTPEIVIPQENLQTGINRFEIGVKRSSFLGSSTYTLEEIETRVNDRKFHDYQDTFQIYDYELQDYVESPLTFSIEDSVMTSPLTVEVNGNELFSREQVRSQQEIEVTPQNADLRTGANEITFSTDRPAEYSINSAQLTMRYLGNVERQNVVFEFNMTDRQLNRVEGEDSTAVVSFDYQNLMPSAREVNIRVNGFSRTLVPENGDNRVELPEETLDNENSFSFRNNGTYQLNRLRIYSEGDG